MTQTPIEADKALDRLAYHEYGSLIAKLRDRALVQKALTRLSELETIAQEMADELNLCETGGPLESEALAKFKAFKERK